MINLKVLGNRQKTVSQLKRLQSCYMATVLMVMTLWFSTGSVLSATTC